MSDALPEHVRRNRLAWDRLAADYAEAGRRGWAEDEMSWGVWGVPERELRMLPPVAGLDVIDLGCGTGYKSAWLARQGPASSASTTPSVSSRPRAPCSVSTAWIFRSFTAMPRQCRCPTRASTSPSPSTAPASGATRTGGCRRRRVCCARAATWCFSRPDCCASCTTPDDAEAAGERLVRSYFGLHRIEWSDDGSVEFDLPHGEWIRLFRATGFTVERLVELRAPAGASSGRWTFVTPEWARRWPSEEIWHARKARA